MRAIDPADGVFFKNRDIRPEKENLDEHHETAGSSINRRGKYIAAIFARTG